MADNQLHANREDTVVDALPSGAIPVSMLPRICVFTWHKCGHAWASVCIHALLRFPWLRYGRTWRTCIARMRTARCCMTQYGGSVVPPRPPMSTTARSMHRHDPPAYIRGCTHILQRPCPRPSTSLCTSVGCDGEPRVQPSALAVDGDGATFTNSQGGSWN